MILALIVILIAISISGTVLLVSKIRFLRERDADFNFLEVKKEFKINDFLTLKLINDETIIYVNNKWFIQCKFLLLDIPINDTDLLEGIESIALSKQIF